MQENIKQTISILLMDAFISGMDLHMTVRRISIASYARLFLASIIPETYERILYLDCDTIVRASLKSFWNTELEGYMVAGVRDTVDSFFLKRIGLSLNDHYVNAGVLLVNLDGWRKNHLEGQFIDFIKKFDGNVPHHDQGTINGVCIQKKLLVSPRFNVTSNLYTFSAKTIKRLYFMDSYYSQKELDEAKKNPAIIHFTSTLLARPWEKNSKHPMKEEYLKIAKISPWKDEPLLTDSRKLAVKAFTWFYNHMPLFLSEILYRSVSGLIHIREH